MSVPCLCLYSTRSRSKREKTFSGFRTRKAHQAVKSCKYGDVKKSWGIANCEMDRKLVKMTATCTSALRNMLWFYRCVILTAMFCALVQIVRSRFNVLNCGHSEVPLGVFCVSGGCLVTFMKPDTLVSCSPMWFDTQN